MSNPTGIGVSVRRKEDLRFITGRGNYVADVKRPDMAYGVFLRSPHAHALIKSIDTSAAAEMPGVLRVLTGADMKADGVGGLPCAWPVTGKNSTPSKEPAHPALAQDKVRCVGDAVAFIVAESLIQARNAAEAIEVEYEPLPAAVGVLDALKPGAPAVFEDIPDNICCDWEVGDKHATEAAFKKAAHVARISLVNNRLVGNPMETRAVVAEYDRSRSHYTMWTTSQFPHIVKLLMGNFVLNIPQHKLRVISPDVGGGFGVKQFHYAEEAVLTWASAKIERPVKWVCERSEGFISDAHGRDHVTEAELAVDETGKFLGLRVTTIANMGAYLSTFGPEHSDQSLRPASFMDYCMPRADDVPVMKVETHITQCTHNPLGVKGCGEVGTIGSPATVINAVVDALAHLGVTHVDMPASPNRVWHIIQSAGAARQ